MAAVTALGSWGVDAVVGPVLLTDGGDSGRDVELELAAAFRRINDDHDRDGVVRVLSLEDLIGQIEKITPVACATSPVVI